MQSSEAVGATNERRHRTGRLDDAIYRTAFEVSPLPICLFDLEGHYLRVNAAFCALIGAEPGDVVGQHVSAFNVPEENHDSEENLRMLRGGAAQSHHVHRRLRTIDGRILHVTASITLLHQDGEPVGILSMVSDITHHMETQAELRSLALHDPLTGLGNRQQLDPVLHRLECGARPAAVCFADLDRFKDINDRYGHHAADLVLASVGRRLRAALDTEDIVLRVGGDELVVIRAGVGDTAAAEALGRLVHDAIAHIASVDEVEIVVRVSVGVAFDPRPDGALLARADSAMYEAKRSGRDRVVVLGPPRGLASSG